jgi:hypothetical protein
MAKRKWKPTKAIIRMQRQYDGLSLEERIEVDRRMALVCVGNERPVETRIKIVSDLARQRNENN